MVKFTDGLAAGVVLALRRAPTFLRVTRNQVGEWDALDQLLDQPAPTEQITVYRLTGPASMVHLLCSRGKHGNASGWFAVATYTLSPEQPTDTEARQMESWRAWCLGQAEALKGERDAR